MEYNLDMEVATLLANPDKLLLKRPFTRGSEKTQPAWEGMTVTPNQRLTAHLPSIVKIVVPQEQFLEELDPHCHAVLFDDNIPSICVKIRKNDYREVKMEKMAVPFQKRIKNKRLLHLTGNKTQFTLVGSEPTEQMNADFVTYKQYWEKRNMEGAKNKMIDIQLSCGDAGMLMYFDKNGRVKARTLSFEDGYVIISHNDDNGERILETVYYQKDGVEYIDSYDDKYMYRYTNDITNGQLPDLPMEVVTNIVTNKLNRETVPQEVIIGGWRWHQPQLHGFKEIPLITKRGDVPWADGQEAIECYEVIYNVFNAIQKRHGWGILYIKGKFKDKAQKIAGSVILNDDSLQGNGDAKYLTPPSPEGMLKTLETLEETIQKATSTTFILPKDISMNGDISGIAVALTQEMDIEAAEQAKIDWQNALNKMVRLFKFGLSKELTKAGRSKGITDFAKIDIKAEFKVWRPVNEYQYNEMIAMLKNAGIISIQTATENNTESAPDEMQRLKKQKDEEAAAKLAETKATLEMKASLSSTNNGGEGEGEGEGSAEGQQNNNNKNNQNKK